jgi:hypothetical protein
LRAKSHKIGRSFRLLVVGDHGEVIPFGRIKGLLVCLLATLIVSFAAACVLGFLYLKQKSRLDLVKEQLRAAQKQSASLRDERDVLMARLVIAESSLKPKVSTTPQSPPQKSLPESKPAPEPVPPVSKEVESVKKTGEPPAMGTGPDSQPSAERTVALQPPQPPVSVSMENFRLSHEAKRNRLTAQFRIKNTTAGSVRLSGKCVLVLRGGQGGSQQVLVLPEVPLVHGEPTGKQGHDFGIRRFFDFTLRAQNLPDRFSFDKGTLYVFDDKAAVIAKFEVPVSLNDGKEPRQDPAEHPEGMDKPDPSGIPDQTRPSADQPTENRPSSQAPDLAWPQMPAAGKDEPLPEPPAPDESGTRSPDPAQPALLQEKPAGEPKPDESNPSVKPP